MLFTGLLLNAQTGKVHPIVFRPAPMPSGPLEGGVERYRSRGHHTEGFDTEEAAIAWVRSQPHLTLTACKWEWSGDGVPAMTEFFGPHDVPTDASR